MAVHETFRLHSTPDAYIFETLDGDDNELLIIDRVSQEIKLEANQGQIPVSATTRTVYGIFGVIRLLAGPYLVVITKREKTGELDGHTVWKIKQTEILPYQRTVHHLNEIQQQDNEMYVSMVDNVLRTDSYYYSTSLDITHTLQRLHNTSPEFLQLPLHERADQRFVWNTHLLREFAQQQELKKYCLPILHGFIEMKSTTIKGISFEYVLISRRSCFRAGTRFYMRGLDIEGNSANYVETEQIIVIDGNKCSFVQTRGSIPLFWSQKPNIKYKPVPVINNSLSHMDAFQNHFMSQVYNYGKQICINLIDQKPPEAQLETTFAQVVNNSQNTNVRYEAFDFHHECRKMRWDRLSILIDRLADEQKQFCYFMVRRDGSVVTQQDGIFRTNCMDCLDRTNVVQSLLARRSLQEQLEKLGILSAGERVEDQRSFETMFKSVWADNADACSVQYAGTGALKTDFTRTGKRTKLGLLRDGANSLIRYFKNNFTDGFRQDSIDLFLGNYIVEEQSGISKPSPFRQGRDRKFLLLALLAISLVAFTLCILSVLLPVDNLSEQFVYILFWGSASVVPLAIIFMYGQEFVDHPRLAQAKTKTE
ncbi:phosphatidylinositol-3-phosphatase SAC1-like [Tubulanus polymorphus]|uniref:phosphatidylinositol-3-phosphatase SAC1-like n=1 Tax=Tubulanus polymorphus TaxID=672921 RepID=UPI003DA61A70